ncbi:MAG: hypothetical protein ABSC93_04820 [Bryobacteraceae bacterium]
MITSTRKRLALKAAMLAFCSAALLPPGAWAQTPQNARSNAQSILTVEQPDAQRAKEEFSALLDRYPPALRGVLALDPALLENQSYLAPYPALISFLNAHPEIVRNPSFYIGEGAIPRPHSDPGTQILDMWHDVLTGLAFFGGFGLAIGLLVWLIRTLVDYKRWSRLAKVQTDAHTKLLDRFTASEDLLAYIQSPAGAKFLESSPISLDAGPRSVGAPLSRILWSVQGGVVLIAGGIGLHIVGERAVEATASQSLHALGIIGIALGTGFLVSAIVSFIISQRLGLIEPSTSAPRALVTGTR